MDLQEFKDIAYTSAGILAPLIVSSTQYWLYYVYVM